MYSKELASCARAFVRSARPPPRGATLTWSPRNLLGRASIASDLTGDFFGSSVGGGRVENRSTIIEQGLHDTSQSGIVLTLRDLSKRCGTAQSNTRQFFARLRDSASDQIIASKACRRPPGNAHAAPSSAEFLEIVASSQHFRASFEKSIMGTKGSNNLYNVKTFRNTLLCLTGPTMILEFAKSPSFSHCQRCSCHGECIKSGHSPTIIHPVRLL